MATTKQNTTHAREPLALDDFDRVAALVRAAGPLAGRLLVQGLEQEDPDLVTEVQGLSGDQEWLSLKNEDDWLRVGNWLRCAFLVGVAYGQRLQPGAFEVQR